MESSDAFSKNLRKYQIYVVVSGLTTLGPLCNLFYLSTGVEFYQLSLIETFSLLVLVFLEVPTGIISDFIGRTKSMALGCFLMGGEYLMIGFGYHFSVFVLAALIGSIGISLESGADDSLLYESLKKLKREHEFKQHLGKSNALFKVSAAVSALIGSYLFSVEASWVFFLFGAILIALAFYALTMKETIERSPLKQSKQQSKEQTERCELGVHHSSKKSLLLAKLKHSIQCSVSNSYVKVIDHLAQCQQLFRAKCWLVALIIFSAFITTLVRAHATLIRPSLLLDVLPDVSWLGVISALGLGIASIVSWHGHLLLAVVSNRGFILLHGAMITLIFTCLAWPFTTSVEQGNSLNLAPAMQLGLLLMVLMTFMLSALSTIFWSDLWHRHFTGKIRGTLLSFKSSCYAIIGILTLNATGFLADNAGLPKSSQVIAVLIFSAVFIALLVSYFSKRTQTTNPVKQFNALR